jgi:hypothetical protein
MLKEIPNTSKVEKFRFNSCLYPNLAIPASQLSIRATKSMLGPRTEKLRIVLVGFN